MGSELVNSSVKHSLLRYAWASPATLLGLLFALIARALGARAVVINGVIEVAGGRLGAILSHLPGMRFRAITFGHVIIGIDHAALSDCRAHEQVHVRQYERWGLLFFPLYLGSSLWQLLRGRRPYWDNHFERQAYRECADD
jgi:hypothetical protein